MPCASSFYAIKCAPGFQCVSKLTSFPLGHDGVFHHTPGPSALEPADPERFRDWLNTYEVGCPARGKLTPAGKCKDNGDEAAQQGFCFSTSGFEGGPDMPCNQDDDCLCVKANTPNGKLTLGHRHLENEDGKEMVQGSYEVQQVTKCDHCEQLSFDREHCEECSNCVFKAKSMGGEMVEACWDKDGGAARRARLNGKEKVVYLNGMTPVRKDINIVPHYPLWDPQEQHEPVDAEGSPEAEGELALAPNGGQRMPYQSKRELLSRDAWVAAYKEVAPRVQRALDEQVKAIEEFGSEDRVKDVKCQDRTGETMGDDIPGMIVKATTIQQSCMSMQEIANRIAVGDQNASFADTAADGTRLHCVHTEDAESSEVLGCLRLNCYGKDVKFDEALARLRKQNDHCGSVWDDEERNAETAVDDQNKADAASPAEESMAPVADAASMYQLLDRRRVCRGRSLRQRDLRAFL
eukprot:TRINITY_DN62239_c0_g1_i1.p1 TRINITY_DN62239_c0_g1~~TRINITY_DN62239_c0_g1_i1.p1  ORF type:complete len:464 (+),score=84.37 TRINITY_DN62239_c0_g1_i1:40-1431(+)